MERLKNRFNTLPKPLRTALSAFILLAAFGLNLSGLSWQARRLKASASPVERQMIVRDGYTLKFFRPQSFPAATANRIVECFFAAYPKEVARFNPKAPRVVTLVLEPTEGVLEIGTPDRALRRQSSLYLQSKPEDIDVVTFGLFHIAADYPQNVYPPWLMNGLADYARHTYGINNAAAGWSLGSYSKDQHYTDSYAVTARFYQWMELRVRPGILDELNVALRERQYTDAFWMQHTGRTLDQLWADYGAQPSL